MRMRKKPNLDARMTQCETLQEKDPAALRGQWREKYGPYKAVWLEIGCGKGRFTAETAMREQDALLIAVEKVPSAMVMAMERVRDDGIRNVVFVDMDASNLGEVFAPGEIDRIYINFCDPWPKSRDAKSRLTAPGFLRAYADILKPGGEIRFKTDNEPLFDWSLESFTAEGWELRELTRDLHAGGPSGVMTDYEAKFYEQRIPIKRVVAVKQEGTKDTSAGQPERLRNAALRDARNC